MTAPLDRSPLVDPAQEPEKDWNVERGVSGKLRFTVRTGDGAPYDVFVTDHDAAALTRQIQAHLQPAPLVEGTPPAQEKCHICGQPATCIGCYEGHGRPLATCDDCCGHGNEDGWCKPIAEYRATQPAPIEGTQTLIEEVIQQVAELPDRTSPDEWPEAMLVTADELRSILLAALAVCARQGQREEQELDTRGDGER